ncbi:START domain-containing protein [Heracleum sosnowskyi]|uniref:START domain-containing protein n=1 Tax=Heracleum sosnowskyi TaxID=360622 RepID=A0AAD8IDX3_9APIA|nr:START domain-containing protein [Heracleum sosnowskyi]
MEQNNLVNGPKGVGSIQNGGQNNHQGAATDVDAWGAGGPSGLAAAGGPSGVTAGSLTRGVSGPSSDSARGRNRRHSRHQINEMEAYFKDDPHPTEWQRNQLARSIGLDPSQVKCWFQNKRSQLKSQREIDENDALQTENDALRARKQQLIEALRKNTCSGCSVGSSGQPMERNKLILENGHLRKEAEVHKSRIAGFMAGQNLQNLPTGFQDPQNISIIPQNPQNLPIISWQNPESCRIISQNPGNLPITSEARNANPNPVDLGIRYASTSITCSGEGINSIDVPCSHQFRQSLNWLVVSAAEELKVLSMSMEPVWISSSADGATSVLNVVEYQSRFPNNFGPKRLGYRCEASRHISRVLMSPAQLLNILMDVNEWAFMFSDIVSKALKLDVPPSEAVNYNTALRLMAVEYHIPTPLVPNRGTYFARYCTQHCKGVWAVVDVSIDSILPTPRNMTCQKRPSGCLIQGLSDGTSKITWIEHVYVDYTGVSTIYRRLLQSGLGFGAKRWVSSLERQCQRILTANVPSSSPAGLNNRLKLSREGRRGILMFVDRMVNNFTFGITGRWTQVKGNFGDDVRVMSTRVVDDPGRPSGTLLSVATSFELQSLAPNIVFNFLRDHKHRKEWDIYANGNEYEPLCRISYGGEATNSCVTICKVANDEAGKYGRTPRKLE